MEHKTPAGLRFEPTVVWAGVEAAIAALNGRKRRSSGQSAILHALAVVAIVKDEFGITDPETIAIAALHDVLEDGKATEKSLRRHFGSAIVDDVIALTKPPIRKKKERKAALFSTICHGSERAKLVKIADFIDNLRARRGTERERSTRKGVRLFLNMLLLEPQTDVVWKAIRILLREERAPSFHRLMRNADARYCRSAAIKIIC